MSSSVNVQPCGRCKGSGQIKIDVLVDCAKCASLHRHFVYDCRNAACVKESIHRNCNHCNGSGIIN
jgi:hypothetical protein